MRNFSVLQKKWERFKMELNDVFGAQNQDELETYAIEDLIFSVQLAIQKVMNSGCISQKELAERLGISAARVSQFLSTEGANLTIKTIAKIGYALGENFILERQIKEFENFEVEALSNKSADSFAKAQQIWCNKGANRNRTPQKLMAA